MVEEVLGPLFPALKEFMSDGGSGESNPNKRSRPDPDMMPAPSRKGTGKGKGKHKSKGQQLQEHTWGGFQGARFRPFGSHQGSWRDAPGLDVEAAIYAMAKLCLKQETELSELRQEKCFLLHLSAAPHGILKPLIQASLKWNDLRDQMKVDCSLKSELFCLLLKEMAARLEKFEQTPESQAAAEKAQWLSNSPMLWLYQKWDPERQALVLDPSRPGVAHQEVKGLLESMRAAIKHDPDALNKFAAKRRLTEGMQGNSVPFKVSIGLRGPHCEALYAAFAKLSGLAVLNLIGANMHRERQKHGREAEEVRNLTWRSNAGSSTQAVPTPATLTLPSCSLFMPRHRWECLMVCWALLGLVCVT